MNGIEKITQRIETDTQAEIDRILGDARAEADDITDRYQAQANNEAAELAAKNQKAAAEREGVGIAVTALSQFAAAVALSSLVPAAK